MSNWDRAWMRQHAWQLAAPAHVKRGQDEWVWIVEQARAGRTVKDIAAELGTSSQALQQRAYRRGLRFNTLRAACCADCGGELPPRRCGKPRKFCEACALSRKRARDSGRAYLPAAADPEPEILCVECGYEMITESFDGHCGFCWEERRLGLKEDAA